MTINEIEATRLKLSEFYTTYLEPRKVTITDASKEPLTLKMLQEWRRAVTIEELKKVVRPGEAFCYLCIKSLIKKIGRRNEPSSESVGYMAEQMVIRYSNWTILDLPCFVHMAVCSRIPSPRANQVEYDLIMLDIPNIMGKVGSYDQMRPNALALQGNSPAKAPALQPIQSEHYGMLMDGTPYDFRVPYEDFVQGYSTPSGSPTVNAERYWRGTPHNGEKDFERFYAMFKALYFSQPILPSVNKVLGLQ
ncbi:MAG: hypothetical protein J6T19_08125 [Paludibacteraceae bacterium]|nr:hypothetical protein [Paludibacteraceae bacterium]